MRRAAPLAAALSLLLLGCSSSSPTPSPHTSATPTASRPKVTATRTAAATPPPSPPKVMVVVLENNSYEGVIGNGSAPAINGLARRYGLATHSYARTHPSLPNYVDMVSGSTFGITSDCTDCYVRGPNLADQLEASGHDWAAYMEDMPSSCYTGGYAGQYGKKHDPFMYFDDIRNDISRCQKVRPFSGFYAALDGGELPAFTFVSPNQCHDGHSCSLSTSDSWVAGFTSHVIQSAWFADGGVLVVTYDEGTTDGGCCQYAAGGHIATLVISRTTPAGARLDTPVDHAGLLRTVESLYSLPYLGEAACTCSGDLLPLLRGSG